MSILAIDFGGTRLRAGWFVQGQHGLTLQKRTETLTNVPEGQQAVIQRIIDTARQVVPNTSQIQAIGVSAPGPLDAKSGVIHHAKTLPGWEKVPLAEIIGTAFDGKPVHMQNDANLAALAEYHMGAGRDCDPMIYMTLSTGIGGGAVINGQLFTGWRGLAIEPGHIRLTLPDGRIVRLEELASGTALGLLAQKHLGKSQTFSVLRELHQVDGKAVGEAALNGDSLAISVVEEAGSWLGVGFVNILHMFNPEAIILGGSVSQLGDLLLNPARQVIVEHSLDPAFYTPDTLRIAQLGDDVCLFGAAFYANS